MVRQTFFCLMESMELVQSHHPIDMISQLVKAVLLKNLSSLPLSSDRKHSSFGLPTIAMCRSHEKCASRMRRPLQALQLQLEFANCIHTPVYLFWNRVTG